MATRQRSSRKRIRAHTNPLSDLDMEVPTSPDAIDWSEHYPAFFPHHTTTSSTSASTSASTSTSTSSSSSSPCVTIADVGCGFGGLLVGLSPLFPDKLALGLEIRERVVQIDKARIVKLRSENAHAPSSASSSSSSTSTSTSTSSSPSTVSPGPYQNIAVVRTNIMKYAPNWFRKGQLEKMFFLFPDPHFKKSNHRRRVINPNFLAMYAYCLRPGGLLYTISDVRDLADWMIRHCSEHPLFERLSDEEMNADPCVEVMTNGTEEGQKVTRLGGSKFPAVFRRKPDPQ